MLQARQEQNQWENDTVSASWAKIEGKGKDEPAEPDSQESCQKLAGQTTVPGDRLQENLLKSVSCRFCHAHVTLLENVSARSGLVYVGLCPVQRGISHRGMCISLILSSLALSPFEVVLDRCLHAYVPGFLSLVYADAVSLSSASLKLFR